MWPFRENWSEVMPSLKADGSLRPDTRWKLRSVGELVSAVDRDIPEKRLRKADGTRLALGGACTCRDACTWRMSCSLTEGWLSVSWSAPPCLRLWRRSSIRMIARISAAPARLPTTLPTTWGVSRGVVPARLESPAAAPFVLEGEGEAVVAPSPPPIQPGPPLP